MSSAGLRNAIVVISDRVERHDGPDGYAYDVSPKGPGSDDGLPPVVGSYLERLPLATVHRGLADFVEIWHHTTRGGYFRRETPHLSRRIFPLTDDTAPFHSEAMLAFIRTHGAPRILCVWGLGVSEALLEACRDSIIIYNSIDAPALRVPPEISRHFDAVLTGAQWQSDVIEERHPGMLTAIMPIGPEFAAPETFFPTGSTKTYDIIYVAAAQPYKRHDVLFEAMARSPRPLSALCVMGYGEEAGALRQRARDLAIDVTFIDPPGVPYADVNRLMNEARVGVVCGVEDGAPAIITEYMLAGLPVVANADLTCGLQYIVPETGLVASADQFEQAIITALDEPERFAPRDTVLARWAWTHTIAKFERLLTAASTHQSTRPADRQGATLESAASA